MPTRFANAVWEGGLKGGQGRVELGSGAFEGAYSFGSRFEDAQGTNPEELLAAAHAGCFSMALSKILGDAGHEPESIRTTARVHLERQDEGFAVTKIALETEAMVPGIAKDAFHDAAEKAKTGCPISKALTPEITLQARLL